MFEAGGHFLQLMPSACAMCMALLFNMAESSRNSTRRMQQTLAARHLRWKSRRVRTCQGGWSPVTTSTNSHLGRLPTRCRSSCSSHSQTCGTAYSNCGKTTETPALPSQRGALHCTCMPAGNCHDWYTYGVKSGTRGANLWPYMWQQLADQRCKMPHAQIFA